MCLFLLFIHTFETDDKKENQQDSLLDQFYKKITPLFYNTGLDMKELPYCKNPAISKLLFYLDVGRTFMGYMVDQVIDSYTDYKTKMADTRKQWATNLTKNDDL